MNRSDRLFAITLLLQAKGRVRAKDLADWFEVSERTIYRDDGRREHSHDAPGAGSDRVGWFNEAF